MPSMSVVQRIEITYFDPLYDALKHLVSVSSYMPTAVKLRPSREELRKLLVELHENRPPEPRTAR